MTRYAAWFWGLVLSRRSAQTVRKTMSELGEDREAGLSVLSPDTLWDTP